MNIFLHELKVHRKSLIIWCFGMIFMVAGGMAKYSGSQISGQSMNDLVANLPTAVKVILGVGSFNLSTAIGFYGMLFLYLAIIATVHAAMLGANVISEEEQDKTSEFLYVKPVSRSKIITSKLIAAIVNMLILNIITYISSLYMVGIYTKGMSVTNIITTLMIGLFILQLLFFSIGTSCSAISKNPKLGTSIANSILLATFIISILVDLSGKYDILKYITPFKYFDAKNLINKGLNSVYLILSASIIIGLLVITYKFYKKRDLIV